MADDIQVVMTADDRDLMQSYLRQGDKLLKLQEQLKRWQKEAMEAGRASKKAADESAAGSERMVRGVVGVAAGWMSASSAIRAFMTANKEAIVDSERHAEVLEDITRKFRLQAGLSAMQGDEAKRAILKNAHRAGVTKDQAFAAGTQLVSSGMQGDEAKGEGLRAFLDVLGALNITGKSVDSEGLSKALMQYLETQGIAKTGANIDQIGGQVQTLFKGTNLQLSGLPFLASEAAGLKSALTPKEQLAAFAKLTGEYSESESATSLRNVVQRLETARGNSKSSAALKQMGINPDEVDFVGENLDQVLGRMETGLQSLPEKERKTALKSIFEEKGIAPLMSMIAGRGDIAKNVALQDDLSGYREDVKLSQQGRGATGRRLTLDSEVMAADSAGRHGETLQAIQNSQRKAGFTAYQRYLSSAAYNIGSGLGFDEENAAHFAINGPSIFKPPGFSREGERFVERDYKEALEKSQDPNGFLARQQEEARKAAEKNTAATERLTDAIKGMSPRAVPAPGPRPISGAGRP